MTLRAGRYNSNAPEWHGVVRDDGSAWYHCTHTTHDERSATECARIALPELKARDHSNPNAPLPKDWVIYQGRRRGDPA